MLDLVRHLLEQSPMLAIFAVIGLGYALGQVTIGGFSLGVGAVLFAGLALGAIAPASAPPGLVGSIGLVMFLYGIGIQYGAQFIAGLRGPGLKWNLLGALGVLASLVVALVLGAAIGQIPGALDRPVRRSAHQHAGAAGCDRRGGQSRPGDRLLGRLPVRRDRADPVPLRVRASVGAADVACGGAAACRSRSP